jgi:hypothetical protein
MVRSLECGDEEKIHQYFRMSLLIRVNQSDDPNSLPPVFLTRMSTLPYTDTGRNVCTHTSSDSFQRDAVDTENGQVRRVVGYSLELSPLPQARHPIELLAHVDEQRANV